MYIYLDANALKGVRTFTEPGWLATLAVSHTLGATIIVPGLAVQEAVAELDRELAEVVDRHDEAARNVASAFALQSYGPAVDVEPQLQPDRVREAWLDRLGDHVVIEPTTPEQAYEGLMRELQRLAPASTNRKQPGSGARDAAIWATVRDHVLRHGVGGVLVTGDKAFARFRGGSTELGPWLADELGDVTLQLRTGLGSWIDLKQGMPANLTAKQLEQQASSALRQRLEDMTEVPGLIFNDDESRAVRTHFAVAALNCSEIIRADDYDGPARLIDSRWEAKLVLTIEEADGSYFRFEPQTYEVRAQLFDASGGEAEVAVLGFTTSTRTAFYRSHGHGDEEYWAHFTVE